MVEVKVAELVKVIGKNGQLSFNTVLGSGRLEVRLRTEKPTEYDLWFVPAWKAEPICGDDSWVVPSCEP